LSGVLTIQPWSAAFAVAVTFAVVVAVVVQHRSSARRWPRWGPPVFLLGWLGAVGTVVSPLDTWSDEGSLTAHVAQHVLLGDLVAPLLLIGLPPAIAALGRSGYDRITRGSGRTERGFAFALSPVGAIALWAGVTYVWVVPPVHRLAIPDGPVHLLDHVSFLVLGLLVWLAAFDFRRGKPVHDWEGLKATLTSSDMPWWARHVYAMVSRVAMLPAVTILWLAATPAYYLTQDIPPGASSQREDQVNASSLMLGFEILLASLAVVLALVWVSVSEGRARDAARPHDSG
jgi:cytochrome c oxidase assembly factor CtaG